MSRIRTVKPEFWSSPDTGSVADPWTRLLYVAMWNWADDSGRGLANPKELAGFAFPHDEHIDSTRVRCMLAEVSRGFGTRLYKIGNRTYYAIPAWDEHQKIDRKSGARYPPPEEGDEWRPCACEQGKPHRFLGFAEPSPSPRRASDEGSCSGTGEQGNRGTEKRAGRVDHLSNAESRARPQSQPLPDDWKPTDLQRQLAAVKGIDVDHEADQFRANAAAYGKTFVNPHEAFRYWVGNASARTNGRPAPAPAPDPDRELTDAEVDEIIGTETPPMPPLDVAEQGVEACKAWARENDPAWRGERRKRAKARIAGRQR